MSETKLTGPGTLGPGPALQGSLLLSLADPQASGLALPRPWYPGPRRGLAGPREHEEPRNLPPGRAAGSCPEGLPHVRASPSWGLHFLGPSALLMLGCWPLALLPAPCPHLPVGLPDSLTASSGPASLCFSVCVWLLSISGAARPWNGLSAPPVPPSLASVSLSLRASPWLYGSIPLASV